MQSTFADEMRRLQSIFLDLDRETIANALIDNDGDFEKAVDELLKIVEQTKMLKKNRQEELYDVFGDRIVTRPRVQSAHIPQVRPRLANYYQNDGRNDWFDKYTYQNDGRNDFFDENSPNRVEPTPEVDAEAEAEAEADAPQEEKVVQRNGNKYMSISSKDKALGSPKLARHSSNKGGEKYYGPDGEEFDLGRKKRSGSFIDRLKVGISTLFRKGARDAHEGEDQYAEVNKVDDNEVQNYFKQPETGPENPNLEKAIRKGSENKENTHQNNMTDHKFGGLSEHSSNIDLKPKILSKKKFTVGPSASEANTKGQYSMVPTALDSENIDDSI